MPTPPQSLADGYVKWICAKVGSQLIDLVYANVVIFDCQGRILAHRRYDFDWWSTTGGALEIGEALSAAARREVKEETGLDVILGGLVGVYSHPRFNLLYPNGDQVQQMDGLLLGGDGRPGPPPRRQRDAGPVLRVAGGADCAHPPLPRRHDPGRLARPSRGAAGGGAGRDGRAAPAAFPLAAPVHRSRADYPARRDGGLVEDDEGRLLMTRRTDLDCWDFPAGFADLGETTTANVVRETQEETGLIVEPYGIVGLYSDPRWYMVRYANGDAVHGIDLSLACRVVGAGC